MVSVERLEAALLKVALMVEREPAVAPVFERLEVELEKARRERTGITEVQRRARAVVAQKAKPATFSAM